MSNHSLDLLRLALTRTNGIAVTLRDAKKATQLRNRLHRARARYRVKFNKEFPLKECEFDTLLLAIEEQDSGQAVLKIVNAESHLGVLAITDVDDGTDLTDIDAVQALSEPEEDPEAIDLNSPEEDFRPCGVHV